MAQAMGKTTARGLSNVPWHQPASSAPDTYAPCTLCSVPGYELSSQHRQKEWGLGRGQLLHLFLCAGKQTSGPSLGGFGFTSGSSMCSSSDSRCFLCASIKVESVTNCISLLQTLFLAKHNFFVLSAALFRLTQPPGRSSLFLPLSHTHELLWLCNPRAAFLRTGHGDKAHRSLRPLQIQVSSSRCAARLSPGQLCPADKVKLQVGSLQNQPRIAKCFGIVTGR